MDLQSGTCKICGENSSDHGEIQCFEPENASSESVHVIDCSAMRPVDAHEDSKLDDSEVSELSSRFVDSLALLPDVKSSPKQETPVQALELKDPAVVLAEKKKFNESMEVISRFAEDVVKTWFAGMYTKDLKELFPDGLIGHVGSIRMTPSEELLNQRKKVMTSPEEETRDGNPADPEDALGWELKLKVVDENYRVNLEEWKKREPAVLGQMQGLLKMAWGYIQYALESYDLPHQELFVGKIIPSPWGTLYVLGALPGAPHIGVSIERPKPELPKNKP